MLSNSYNKNFNANHDNNICVPFHPAHPSQVSYIVVPHPLSRPHPLGRVPQAHVSPNHSQLIVEIVQENQDLDLIWINSM